MRVKEPKPRFAAKADPQRKETSMATGTTVRRPFADFGELRNRVDQILHEMTGGDGGWAPSVDVIRDNGNLVLRADLPGIKPEEVKVTVDGVLEVTICLPAAEERKPVEIETKPKAA
jgi:HSP20 family molecular chaperone IbpA